MPVYIGKSGDLVGSHRCLTHTQTDRQQNIELLSLSEVYGLIWVSQYTGDILSWDVVSEMWMKVYYFYIFKLHYKLSHFGSKRQHLQLVRVFVKLLKQICTIETKTLKMTRIFEDRHLGGGEREARTGRGPTWCSFPILSVVKMTNIFMIFISNFKENWVTLYSSPQTGNWSTIAEKVKSSFAVVKGNSLTCGTTT